MATAVSPAGTNARSSDWARRYPPLLALLVAVFIAIAILPSSLNLPQSNPSTTLEFAPVPPQDDKTPPPPDGNLASLGLAGSSSLTGGGLPGGDSGSGAAPLPPPNGPLQGAKKSSLSKKCVNTPSGPRQTEDPLSPPCVVDFKGDNGGATYLGVDAEEIRILFYFQGNYIYINNCKDPNQVTPDNQYFDAMAEPKPNDHCILRIIRAWQTYFNDRYQTYGRYVHFFAYVSGSETSPEQRKAEAAENFDKVKPFAVIHDDLATENIDSYLDAMAKRGTLVFEASFGRSASFFTKYAPRIWGYFPTQEIIAGLYAGMVCKKTSGLPVAVGQYAGTPQRKYGLVYTTDPDHPELRIFKDLVEAELKSRCGITVEEGTYPSAGWTQDTRYTPRQAQQTMAKFSQDGVTTILWPGGLETNMTRAATSIGYTPEWIIAGDRQMEEDSTGLFQDSTQWQNAFVATTITAQLNARQTPCYMAYREADPNADDSDIQTGCPLYDYLRQLFTGIQVAGPRLTPQAMDKGFHAIPAVRSTDPKVPACFYSAGDYTCVKDAQLERWDPSANSGQGCYRMIEGGQRYTADTWPDGNIDAQYDPATAPCNTYDSGFQQNPGAPNPNNPNGF
ncbi:MAG TPA: hypothetical protein VHN98_13070 [Acidimicrobiales bacterium]|nr:hypothetical protein [Acidimicrobiales bacterium]